MKKLLLFAWVFFLEMWLIGCSTTSTFPEAKAVSESYRELFEVEDQFRGDSFDQNPNRDVTYLGALGEAVGQVLQNLDEVMPRGATSAAKERLMIAIMKKYGLTASFVAFPSLPQGMKTDFCIPEKIALGLRARLRPESNLFKTMVGEAESDRTVSWDERWKLER